MLLEKIAISSPHSAQNAVEFLLHSNEALVPDYKQVNLGFTQLFEAYAHLMEKIPSRFGRLCLTVVWGRRSSRPKKLACNMIAHLSVGNQFNKVKDQNGKGNEPVLQIICADGSHRWLWKYQMQNIEHPSDESWPINLRGTWKKVKVAYLKHKAPT